MLLLGAWVGRGVDLSVVRGWDMGLGGGVWMRGAMGTRGVLLGCVTGSRWREAWAHQGVSGCEAC